MNWVDRSTPKIGLYLPAGGISIPVQPLQPGATHRASVTLTASKTTLSKSRRLTTAR